MNVPTVSAPKLLIDFSFAGFRKGIYKFFGPVTVGLLLATLSQYLPALQERINTEHDIKIVLGSSIIIGIVKFLITWLTTTDSEVVVSNQLA